MNELVDNAIESCVRKASKAGGAVHGLGVDVWVVGGQASGALIVRDEGEGMSATQLGEMMTYFRGQRVRALARASV